MSAKAKGSRRERQSRDLLEAKGYAVTKAGGSLGVFDLIGINSLDCVLVQVKANRAPGPAERQRMRDFKAPSFCRKLIHVWIDHKRGGPVITEVR